MNVEYYVYARELNTLEAVDYILAHLTEDLRAESIHGYLLSLRRAFAIILPVF